MRKSCLDKMTPIIATGGSFLGYFSVGPMLAGGKDEPPGLYVGLHPQTLYRNWLEILKTAKTPPNPRGCGLIPLLRTLCRIRDRLVVSLKLELYAHNSLPFPNKLKLIISEFDTKYIFDYSRVGGCLISIGMPPMQTCRSHTIDTGHLHDDTKTGNDTKTIM